MSQSSAERVIQKMLKDVGITIDGNKPWDPKVHNSRAYERILSQGSLGAGESYMDGWWDCQQLDELVARLANANSPFFNTSKRVLVTEIAKAMIGNPQSILSSRKNVSEVYDLGNDLYEAVLGRTMAYTCGYWENTNNLDEAQDAKYDLICKKLQLRPNMTLLDIGCGWGGLLAYAQKHYKAKVTGLTLSKEQAKYIANHHKNIKVILQDYREFKGKKFERIATVGMIEHVGPKNYNTFFKKVSELLTDDGIYLLHTIGTDKHTYRAGDAWISKYIFPGGFLPSVKQLAVAFESVFLLEDWHNFGMHYDKTLLAWYDNFEKAWPKLEPKYGPRFYRMWRFYLLTCAGLFRNRRTNLWQIVLTKDGLKDEHVYVR